MEHRAAGQERNGVLRLLSLELLFADEVCAGLLSDEKLLAAMARFEGALARASARHGLVPAAHAEMIARVCEAARFDASQLARAGRAGTLAIPFVKAAHRAGRRGIQGGCASCARRRHQPGRDRHRDRAVRQAGLRPHRRAGGATGQCRRRARAASRRARRQRRARCCSPRSPFLSAGRPQYGSRCSPAASPACAPLQPRACVLQFGGPSGTLASLGDKGADVLAALARELELRPSLVPWHSARDGFARLGAELAILAGAAGKIGRDISLLMQPEVGEAAEAAAEGRGGSSSMPHKRNPALSMIALEAAQRAPGLAATLLGQLTPEHERGLGQWQSQWFTLRDLLCATSSGVAAMADALEGLEVDQTAMRKNLESLLQGQPHDAFGAAPAMIEAALAEWGEATSRGTAP